MTIGMRIRPAVVHLVNGDPERVGEGAKTLCCGRKLFSLRGSDAITNDNASVTCETAKQLELSA